MPWNKPPSPDVASGSTPPSDKCPMTYSAASTASARYCLSPVMRYNSCAAPKKVPMLYVKIQLRCISPWPFMLS